ncbi:MAG: TonB-dependent receptor [Bacteroidales bacterium]|nr:TonB-dependent receptor [Bacteroidales bacterium]
MRAKFLNLLGLLLIIFFTSSSLYAQKTITGKVVDNRDIGLPGVTIVEVGTANATITDLDGNYSLKVSENAAVLEFNMMGMKTENVEITSDVINLKMTINDQEIGDVVVIGYGKVKKGDVTGSISTLGSKDFIQGSISSPQDLISGKIPGVSVTSSGGAPGSSSVIRIRGGSSLSASNDPLIVIDGIPVENSDVAGMRNPLNVINPEDIESFTVLKDASATAIYGSRASNGVIIITTKKSQQGAPFKISYTVNTAISTLPNKLDVLSADEYRTLITEKYGEGSIQANLLGTSNTDWQNEIYQNAFNQEHNLSLSGSVKVLPYRVSLSYTDQKGVLKTDGFQRMSGAILLNPKLMNDHLNITVNVRGTNVQNQFADGGAVGAAVRFDPTQSVLVDDQTFGGYYTWLAGGGNPITIATKNPVALLNQRENISNVNRILASTQLDYKLHFLPDLHFNVNLALDRSESNGTNIVPDNASFDWDPSGVTSGYNSEYSQVKSNELLETYLNYSKDLSTSGTRIDVMGGYSWQHLYSEDHNFSTNYSGDADTSQNDYSTEYYLISLYGRLNFTVKDRYILTATLRDDGTSRFSPENRWGLFPSAAFAWKISEESFMKNVTQISDMKFRIGYGITGQQNIGQGNYPYLARYTYSYPNAAYPFGSTYYNTLRPEAYNYNLKWEETTTYNVGLDFGLFKNRIVGSVDLYKRVTNDLLNVIPIPAGTNFNNTILSNIGSLENKGVEFNFNFRPIVKTDVFWEIGFNVSYNKNEITKLTVVEDPDYIGVTTGGISGGIGNTVQMHSVGYPASTFYLMEQIYDADGNPIEGAYVDRNNDGVVNDQDKYLSYSPNADYLIGFSTRFNYKNIDLSMSARGSIGNFVYDNISSVNGLSIDMYNSAGYLNNVTNAITDPGFNDYQLMSDYYVKDASFLRMDNISLGYSKKLFNEKLKFRIATSVQNVFVISKYNGLDPEIYGGIDNNMYPRPRIFSVNLNIEF